MFENVFFAHPNDPILRVLDELEATHLAARARYHSFMLRSKLTRFLLGQF